jgi:monoamine oxidase
MKLHGKDGHRTEGLNRREFIKAGSATVGALVLTGNSAMVASDSTTHPAVPDDYDVIVLGGGFAGITAARELRRKGHSVLVIESRNRLGGRTLTVNMRGHHFEFGGFWVHWTQPYVWAEINRYNLPIVETPGSVPDKVFMSMAGSPVELPASEIMSGNAAFEKLFAKARRIWERPYDQAFHWDELAASDNVSVAEAMLAMNFTEEEKFTVDALVGVMAHTTSDKASYVEIARWYAAANFHYDTLADATARYTFKDGTISLINAMVEESGPDILLNTAAQRVQQHKDSVTVHTADGKLFHSRVLVNTLPMNVVGDVEFHPPLSVTKMTGYKEKHAGVGLKTYLEIEGQWGKLVGLDSSHSPLCFVMTYEELPETTILLGFGSNGRMFDPNDRKMSEQALQRILAGAKVISATGYNWLQDPNAQGTWCSYKPTQLARFGTEMTRAEGRIFMGSGDHGEGWRGAIDGAIGRGIRVADEAHEFVSQESQINTAVPLT